MRSILRQLAKYEPPPEADKARQVPAIELKVEKHPYQDMVEKLCDCTDLIHRKKTVNDALLFLNDFNPPAMADELFPLELAVLYHLFYRHKLQLCGESRTDRIFAEFLKRVAERDGGLDRYMAILKNMLDKTSTAIFLYRVMLAALGERGRYDSPKDHVERQFGLKAAQALGVEATARRAARGQDSLAGVEVEKLILGRITYLAFWQWSRTGDRLKHNDYLALPAKT